MMKLNVFKVTGRSMLPTFKDNDFVLTCEWLVQPYSPGDVVVIDHPHMGTIIKRIVRKARSGLYLVAGDNRLESTSTYVTGFVHAEQILGRVLFNLTQLTSHFYRPTSHDSVSL